MKPVLELNQLQVSLHSRKQNYELVKSVSFSVMQGECLGILGESGSRKINVNESAMGILDKTFLFREVLNLGERN